MILDLITIPLSGAFDVDGTVHERFLRGQAAVCRHLLDAIDLQLLRVLFSELPSDGSCESERLALFHLIAHKCRHTPGALESMTGGIGFFKHLLYQRSPALAFHG